MVLLRHGAGKGIKHKRRRAQAAASEDPRQKVGRVDAVVVHGVVGAALREGNGLPPARAASQHLAVGVRLHGIEKDKGRRAFCTSGSSREATGILTRSSRMPGSGYVSGSRTGPQGAGSITLAVTSAPPAGPNSSAVTCIRGTPFSAGP